MASQSRKSTSAGGKFGNRHQLAIILTDVLGVAGALRVCRENLWHGVAKAIREQQQLARHYPVAAK
jgi:hypothetical protein